MWGNCIIVGMTGVERKHTNKQLEYECKVKINLNARGVKIV